MQDKGLLKGQIQSTIHAEFWVVWQPAHLCCSLHSKVNSITQVEVSAYHSNVAWPVTSTTTGVM